MRKKGKCINCGCEIYIYSMRCHKCYGKTRRGRNHPMFGIRGEKHPAWKGGKKNVKIVEN